MNKQDNFSDEINQVSKYNDAGLSISRLDESWTLCKTFMRRGNYSLWKNELDAIWMELYPDVLRHKKHKTLMKRNTLTMQNIARAKLTKNRNVLFHSLMKRHCFLREVQDAAGKAGVYVDEDEEGFE